MKRDLTIISLGAGVQSTVLLLMALEGEIKPMPDCAIFADTGWESKATYRHLEWVEEKAKSANFTIHRVTAGNVRQVALDSKKGKRFATMPLYTLADDGSAGMLRRNCTREFKVDPIMKRCRGLMGYKKGERIKHICGQMQGITTDELRRMRESRIGWCQNMYPFFGKRMSRFDCMKWMENHGYPIPPKSACLGCPYHSDAFYKDLKRNSPGEFADVVDFDRQIRRGLRGVNCEAFLHRSLKPMDEVDFGENQMEIFDQVCEGMCGI